tara:strand:+ start:1846 stop:2007 length:162 start_codon:yes stop_codon:yes gene_type:complete
MNKLERLKKAVVDTRAAYDDAGADPAASYADYIAAYHAWSKSLSNYKKEQDNV